MNVLGFIKDLNKKEVKIDEFRLCIFIFMVCGILGYFVEETYDTLYNMKLDKNGFLYGLFLPIYGWSGIVIHFVTNKIKKNPILTFLAVTLFIAIIEYYTGVLILEIWGKRFWDYSDFFLNLNGHICLFSVIAFGIFGSFYVYLIEPLIKLVLSALDDYKIDFCLKCFLIIYFIDNIFSFLVKNKF